MALQVRILTAGEIDELRRLAPSRAAPHRMVRRAQIIWGSVLGDKAPTIAQ
ncbi:MAG: hypothetical protein ACRERE_32360 [Candidatus Entotheonellia bacterium]